MIYSPFKAAHHLDRIAKLRKGELIHPTQIQIDLTNDCNHRCPYCFYRCAKTSTLNALFDEQDFIPADRMKELLDELEECGKPALQFTGGGEPFAHDEIYEILDKTVKKGYEYAIVSNGTLMDPSRMDLYKKASWIRISIDAATPETYVKSQGAKAEDFHDVMKLLRSLVVGCPDVIIGVSFTVSPINYKEIVAATELAEEAGVDNIRLSVAYTPKGIEIFRDKWDEIEQLAHKAKKFETKEFKVFNLITSHLENLDFRQKGYSYCGYQHFTAVIGADQIVYPCCTLKYNSVTGFGSLKDRSFKDIWFGEERKLWLEYDHLKNVCDKHPCWMDAKNSFISYLVRNNAPHVNYI
jgi:MoaA/NifB/PqqE/SkfB family radical SAM enzyme